MSLIVPAPLLQLALRIDAVGSGSVGLLHLAAAAPLAALLQWPFGLVVGSGLFMLVYAVTLLWLAARRQVRLAAVRVIVWGNASYALGCLLLAWLVPALNGYAIGHLLLQAVAVTAFALLQARGLQRSLRPAAPAEAAALA